MLFKIVKSKRASSLMKLGILYAIALANNVYSSAASQHKSLSEAIAHAMKSPNSDKNSTGRYNNFVAKVLYAAEFANQASDISAASAAPESPQSIPPLIFSSPLPTTASTTVAEPAPADVDLKEISAEERQPFGKIRKTRTCKWHGCGQTVSSVRYASHMRKHKNLNRYKCSFIDCSYTGNHEHNAARHYSSHIRKQIPDCPDCAAIEWPKAQEMPIELVRHIKKAHLVDNSPHLKHRTNNLNK